MSKIDDIITQVEITEGGEKVTIDPSDTGGRTQYGISEKSNPDAWKDGKVTETEAREIYLNKYVRGPKFDHVPPSTLQSQLIDYGVNSGPAIAISKLQALLHVNADGVLGPDTLKRLAEEKDLNKLSNLLVGERIKMICKIVQKDPSQLKYLGGWIARALEFLV